ncbi:MAG: peptidase [Pseudomonadota bacterium]|nr:peptidase [Pseudomonadota bacterium]
MRNAPVLLAALLCVACRPQPVDVGTVLDGYRAVAYASYSDALMATQQLQRAVSDFVEQPSEQSLRAARVAWRAARVPYAQTEALRFGNWFVDEWELGVNAWPVDEGFLDYVAEPYAASPTNALSRANLIASTELMIGGLTLRTDPLKPSVLISAQGRSDVEANVATGFHAIEFMLWGQDRHGYGAGAGERPWTDYATDAAQCTDGDRAAPLRHCERRRAFLSGAVELLRLALVEMTPTWGAQSGSYGDRLVKGDADEGLRRVLFGLATMASAELAGERMQVALLARAPEEEQDCFSDDTHNSLYYNALGIENFYYGRYGGMQAKASLADLARRRDAVLATEIDRAFERSRGALRAIQQAGEQGERFDQLIAPQHPQGAQLIGSAIAALQAEAALLETLGQRLGLGALDPHHPDAGE